MIFMPIYHGWVVILLMFSNRRLRLASSIINSNQFQTMPSVVGLFFSLEGPVSIVSAMRVMRSGVTPRRRFGADMHLGRLIGDYSDESAGFFASSELTLLAGQSRQIGLFPGSSAIVFMNCS
ncbi:MAG: hypothetical protein ACE5OZ_11020 [Candidatus Heimdallarchaeota archaeon]